jgi:hypothetical protein
MKLLVKVRDGNSLGAYTAPGLREVIHSEGRDGLVGREDEKEEVMILRR